MAAIIFLIKSNHLLRLSHPQNVGLQILKLVQVYEFERAIIFGSPKA